MPTPTKGTRFGGSPAHQRLILANLATSLFEHGRITTTEAKARRLRPFAEHLITKAKQGDLHARRQVLATITDKSVVHTLFTEIGPRFATRPGGYTRITKIGPRKGDNAAMAVIELVEEMTARPSRTDRPARTAPSKTPAAPAPADASLRTEEPVVEDPAVEGAVVEEPVEVVVESVEEPVEVEPVEVEPVEVESVEPVVVEASAEPVAEEQPQDDKAETDITPPKE